MVNNAFEKARQQWSDKLSTLTLEEVLKTEELEERISHIIMEANAFRKMGPILSYFEETPQSQEEAVDLIIEIPQVKKSDITVEYPDNYFKFKRMVRGGELINLNNEHLYADQIYIPEHVVRDFGLVTGNIVEATVEHFDNGSYKNTITHIVEQSLTEESFNREEYSYLIVDKGDLGHLYATRFATGGYAKNESGDILRFALSENDVNRYKVSEGSIIDVAVDLETDYYCISFVHRTDSLPQSNVAPKKKKVKEQTPIEETDSTLFDGIDYDLDVFKGKSFLLMAGEHLLPRYEQLFIDELGMELYQYNTDTETHQMAQKIESGVDYAIACPSVVNHDATNLFKDAAKRSKIHYTFSRYDGPKQVLLSLIELDKRVKGRAS